MNPFAPSNLFNDGGPSSTPIIQVRTRNDTSPSDAQSHAKSSFEPTRPHAGEMEPNERRNASRNAFTRGQFPGAIERDNDSKKDIVKRIPHLYRVLDLISEQGSGGLVDKIIIAGEGLKDLINALHPGACVTLTKVDFKALDSLSLRPVGVYGDRGEIIKFLSSLGVVNEKAAQLLQRSQDGYSGPNLRSGIYIARPPGSVDALYAIYWPQDATWRDNAPSGPRRNRETFMRYLTKISDQIICLMSPDQSQALVWDHDEKEDEKDTLLDEGGDEGNEDRLFTFEITQTNEQEEGVVSRPGFQFESPLMKISRKPESEEQARPPILMRGETSQGFISIEALPPRIQEDLASGTYNPFRLRDLLRASNLLIECELEDDAIEALIDNGLINIKTYRQACMSWRDRKKVIIKDVETKSKEMEEERIKSSPDVETTMGKELMAYLVGRVIDKYPLLDPERLSGSTPVTRSELSKLKENFCHTLSAHQAEDLICERRLSELDKKLPPEFKDQKYRVACVRIIAQKYHSYYNEEIVKKIIDDGSTGKPLTSKSEGFWQRWWNPFARTQDFNDADFKRDVEQFCDSLTDQEFLGNIDIFLKEEPLVEPATRLAVNSAYASLSSNLTKLFGHLQQRLLKKRREAAMNQAQEQIRAYQCDGRKRSADLFIQDINSVQIAEDDHSPTVVLTQLQVIAKRCKYGDDSFDITAQRQLHIAPSLEYKINQFQIPIGERHNLQLDPSFIPTPSVNKSGAVSFALPPGHQILYAQMLENDRVLLVVDDKSERFKVYLDHISHIGDALQNSRPKKALFKHDRLGQDPLVSFDETRRLLVLCSPQKIVLHVFLFDEQFTSLQSWASPFELREWYNNNETISHICCVTGSEEVLLVDSRSQARIYSFVSQRFRPASIPLPAMPVSVMSSPDGACALLVFEVDGKRILNAYHWDTFGASAGINITLPRAHGSLAVTSFVNRPSVHLLMVDEEDGICQSLVLNITKKSSEFMFKEQGTRASVDVEKSGNHVNNCLIDCFGDVWTRFPVVTAVNRQTLMSSATREPKRIVFVSDRVHGKYASYFADMVRTFEEQTKKPTDGQLRAISIDAKTYPNTMQDLKDTLLNRVSRFTAGQWFANLLCLLPIHIAVARDNRFVPLKDGISSVEFEKSLLGADVGRIVDSLSFGWYESILRSYMADKPVKVVSSMGEQSVGKSFALNHLMDTSFAGSAMRTTEGVWMSITPTDDALLVALDFEGVHSIERSPQEDALLVLFNTAISNLVLFRNNFALSRDIADLFQSFQASSVILDPSANPSLFQSTLVIIIKDVVESDKREIVREFSLKFQKIVQQEQAANFISKLHAGRLNIIPWPVIESNQFYALFSTLKRRLDSQKVTHPSAGEFLYTLKVLMAKLKANDWGAMSQSLAAHRAQTLLATLPIALQYGLSEAGSTNEPLKNLDNDTVVDYPDLPVRLFLSSQAAGEIGREEVLADLRRTWEKYDSRNEMDETTWMDELTTYLNNVVRQRVAHVEEWVLVNLQRFKTSNANVELLHRELMNSAVDLQANVDLCKMTCTECNLACTLSRRHDPSTRPHDCNTDHNCKHPCDYGDEHPEGAETCQSSAGHNGPHICVVDRHLCGEPCVHRDKKGCQGDCTQMVGHDDDHVCSARRHACGKPCALIIGLRDKKFACTGTCAYPCDETHDQHVCDNRMCPITCELCKRLCSNSDHLHGLDASAVHLCGEVHHCHALCAAGICEIDTQPLSIEATFTGRHETFQYTKYTQAAKLLQCVKPIPVGQREHEGQHIHSLDPSPFHFCEIRCGNCGYYCTLPRGHPQQEHETSHGSMSRTRWSVDGPDGTVMELNGRRFGTNDEGAPMMCNLVCQSMGRHAHIDYCRSQGDQRCNGPDHEHITARLAPNADRPKDWISHRLYWRRSGFKDPYSRDDQTTFAKCDAMCSGPEHAATTTQPAQPSYCTLPIFHPPHTIDQLTGLGYVSNDGHLFSCKNPVVMQQAFHVIFVIDRSGSMSQNTPTPLPATPVTPTILRRHNDRLGAVYLSLYGFWKSRQTALTNPGGRGQGQASSPRRDSYSVLLFNHSVTKSFENDFQRTPENLVQCLLQYEADGGTNYDSAIIETEAVMRRHWNTERSPVVIFLSDGECGIVDSRVRTLCRAAVSLGRPLSFHAVSFGPSNQSLRRMAQVAREVESSAPRDASLPANAHIESSYAEALDSVRLAETFLGIADSLKKPRGALLT